MSCGTTVRLCKRLSQIGCKPLFCSTRLYQMANNDPSQLGVEDVGSLYRVAEEDIATLKFKDNLPPYFYKQVNTLGECVWLCRRPFLEVKSCLEAVSVSRPSLRIVLWGSFGTGKTLTLCQSLHYAHLQKWVVFHIRSAMFLTRKVEEIQMSTYHEGRINTPAHAVALLENFKANNLPLWKQLSELETTKTYEWSKADVTKKGQPLTEIVEMGLSAPFAASDCVGVLLKELKAYSSLGSIKLLVTIDKANSLYGKTLVKRADRTYAPPCDLTLVHHLRKLFENDWKNGACLLIADKSELSNARDVETIPINTPLELFGDEGFDAIDPFVPIETPLYSEEELSNLYDYYKEKMWIATKLGRTDRARKEMMYISAFNPYNFERLCAFN